MLEYKEKRKFKKVLYSKPVIVILLILIIFSLKPVWNAYSKYSESRERVRSAQDRLMNLENRQESLSSSIERLGTERGREEEIIERFDVAREGEEIIVIVDRRDGLEEVEDEEKDGGVINSFWQRIKDIF